MTADGVDTYQIVKDAKRYKYEFNWIFIRWELFLIDFFIFISFL